MEVKEILLEVRRISEDRIPMSNDKSISGLVKEANRKIGSWRKTLWLSGVLRDQRQGQLPKLLSPTDRREMQLVSLYASSAKE